jgi:ADP-dependent NAD(P)H-hydrate dehydratase / NAD(P)H-hydrate epimerase
VTVRVVTAAEAAARDAAAIRSGVPSRALMQRAGAAAAAELCQRFAHRLAAGVAVYTGAGNNGGDGWVVAGALAAAGIRVRVEEVLEARTDDARAEREAARAILGGERPTGQEGVIVDALLGTGARARPRDAVAGAIARMDARRRDGAAVVALDLPSGVDATTGDDEGAVTADLTVTFGTMKRGALIARDRCGAIVVLDIGLGAHADLADGAPALVDAAWVHGRVPPIAARAHKGTRGRLVIVGGAAGGGMAGASVLAAHAALRSGAGMVRLVVAPENMSVVQTAAYDALANAWPESDDAVRGTICEWADAVLIGPGLGRSDAARALLERVLRLWRGPVVADADALNLFEGNAPALAALLRDRPALITPHPAEAGRLVGARASEVVAQQFDVAASLAKTLDAAVLLKGVPTVVAAPGGDRYVSGAGTPALATAGSGDLLAGIAATLVMQRKEAAESGACAAWIHGRAAEIATGAGPVRGTTLDQVTAALRAVWAEPVPAGRAPVLAELPAVPA